MAAPVKMQKWDRGDFDMDDKSSVGRNSYYNDSESPQNMGFHEFLNTSYAESPIPFEQNVQLVFDPAVFDSSDQLMIDPPRRVQKSRNDWGWSKRCFCATSIIILSLLGFLVVITSIIYFQVSMQVTRSNQLMPFVPFNGSMNNITLLKVNQSAADFPANLVLPGLSNASEWITNIVLKKNLSKTVVSSLPDLL